MNELVDLLNIPFVRFIAAIICLGLPAWALLYFDDHEF